jgi:hypothetical protein
MHSVAGACVSMSRRKLSTAFMSEDEARGDAHEELQAENARRVSDLQTAHCTLLLSCEVLQEEQMSGAVLSQHQAEAAAAEPCSTVSSGESFVNSIIDNFPSTDYKKLNSIDVVLRL